MKTPENTVDPLTNQHRILLALDDAVKKLEDLEREKTEPIAIVGIGCRFPGGASDPDSFWQVLQAGVDAISETPRDRWNLEDYYDPDPVVPG
ncbi:MAG: beta-ketoacyl synthase N-terminal-like domain-containing protein, partial [Cyanobacteria bacterium P01_E01_bin.34]